MLREACGILAVWTVLGGPVLAGMTDEENLDPWETCALCHSLDGVSRMPKFPKLAGQLQPYIEKQLRDFSSGARSNDGGQMAAIAADLDAAKRAAVATYFAGLEVPAPSEEGDENPRIVQLIDKGSEQAGIPACLSCHGSQAVSESGAPRLEAQHASYLAKQLRDFQAGTRANDPKGVMRRIAGMLREEDVDLIAMEFASRARGTR